MKEQKPQPKTKQDNYKCLCDECGISSNNCNFENRLIAQARADERAKIFLALDKSIDKIGDELMAKYKENLSEDSVAKAFGLLEYEKSLRAELKEIK